MLRLQICKSANLLTLQSTLHTVITVTQYLPYPFVLTHPYTILVVVVIVLAKAKLPAFGATSRAHHFSPSAHSQDALNIRLALVLTSPYIQQCLVAGRSAFFISVSTINLSSIMQDADVTFPATV